MLREMRIKDVCFMNCDFTLFISIYFIIVIINMIRDNQFILEIHACNNPSPVLKRCILRLRGGGVRLDRGGGYQNVSRCTKIFQDI